MQFAFWIPWAVLAWHKAPENGPVRAYLRVATLVSAQILSCIYYGVFLVTWLGAMTAFRFWRTPVRALKAGAATLVPPLLILAIYSIPYLHNREKVGDRKTNAVMAYSARASDFVSAPATNQLYGWSASLGVPERHLFPGLVAIGLLVVGLWPPLNRTVILHVVGLIAALELTFGFNAHVYQLLYDLVLPFRGLRVPARAYVLVLLGLAVIAGVGLAPRDRGRTMEGDSRGHLDCGRLRRVLHRPAIEARRSRDPDLVLVAQGCGRRGRVRVASDGSVASLQHGGSQLHGPVDPELATDAERVQRLLPALVPAPVIGHALVPGTGSLNVLRRPGRHDPGAA